MSILRVSDWLRFNDTSVQNTSFCVTLYLLTVTNQLTVTTHLTVTDQLTVAEENTKQKFKVGEWEYEKSEFGLINCNL